MANTTCISIKSNKEPYLKCGCKVLVNDLCSRHSKQKKVQIWKEMIHPLMSHNDIDPISLDVIWKIKDKKKVLGDLREKNIFTYKTIISNQIFYRALNIDTMKRLLEAYDVPKCPFSNLPLSNNILNDAKQQIIKCKTSKHKYTKTETYKMNLSQIIDQFKECGYRDIQPQWLYDMSTQSILKWNYELYTISNNFRRDYPEFSMPDIDEYIDKDEKDHHRIVSNMVHICKANYMGVQMVISALAWTNYHVEIVYPELHQ